MFPSGRTRRHACRVQTTGARSLYSLWLSAGPYRDLASELISQPVVRQCAKVTNTSACRCLTGSPILSRPYLDEIQKLEHGEQFASSIQIASARTSNPANNANIRGVQFFLSLRMVPSSISRLREAFSCRFGRTTMHSLGQAAICSFELGFEQAGCTTAALCPEQV